VDFVTHSHKNAQIVLDGDAVLNELYRELIGVISGISDQEIIEDFASNYEGKSKSLSLSINKLLDEKLTYFGWEPQAPIFAESAYGDRRWRLDFSKKVDIEDDSYPGIVVKRETGIAVEVAFNHGEAIAWNLLKPTLAAQQNHVKKSIQADIGIVICATDALKAAGSFDSAVGSYEKFLSYMRPLSNVLTTPILVIGLLPPKTFKVRQESRGNKKVGFIEVL
jgi:hypothetical protein